MITGPQVKAARKALGLTWKQAAEMMRVNWRSVARWEAIEGPLSPCILRKIQRMMWTAARQRHTLDVCDKCCGAGYVPRAVSIFTPTP